MADSNISSKDTPNYNLFDKGNYDEARKASQEKFKGTEVKNPTEDFAGKYGNTLVGTKLVKAIDEFSKQNGIGGADKQTLVTDYITNIRKPVMTGDQVQSAYKEDLKGNALVNYGPSMREGYKKLEPYGIKVADGQKEEVPEPEKKETKKSSAIKAVSGAPKKEENKGTQENKATLSVAKSNDLHIMPTIGQINGIGSAGDIGKGKLEKPKFDLNNIGKMAPDNKDLVSLAETILDRAAKEKYAKQRKPGAGDVATIK